MEQSPPGLRCRHASAVIFVPYENVVFSPVMGNLPQHCISFSSIVQFSQNDTGNLPVRISGCAEVFIPHFRDIVYFLDQLAGIATILLYPVGDQLLYLVDVDG
jgi:hypothetical protein